MNKLINYAVCGALAAGLMLVARLGLMHLNLPNYPALALSGQAGFHTLLWALGEGAIYGLAWGLLVRGVLPAGILAGALVFSLVPFLVNVLALPLWHGESVNSEPWPLAYKALHYFIFSLGLVFLGRQAGGSD
ncbi:MAG: hypothetical protein V4498_05860 [candidate division FCPU426 bacterium]